MGLYRVTLTGGEPLTRPDFREIYEELADMGLLMGILSNASLINDEVIDLFRRRPPTSMRFTLYGTNNETYERLCGVPGGFDLVMRSLRRLSDAGIGYSLAFTETTENIGELDEAQRSQSPSGWGIAATTSVVNAVRGATNESDELRVPSRSARTSANTTLREASPRGAEERLGPEDAFSMCGPYRNGFFLQWNGDLEVCSFMSWCRARPFEVGFRAAWGSSSRSSLPYGCLRSANRANFTAFVPHALAFVTQRRVDRTASPRICAIMQPNGITVSWDGK